MANWNNAIVTKAGHALEQKLLGTGDGIKLVRASAGKGWVNPVQLESQTAVSDPVQELELKDLIRSATDATVTIPVMLSNAGLQTKYNLTQVGVFAQDPDGNEEVLYFIAQYSEQAGESIPSQTESPGFSVDWNFGLNTANASKVEVVLNEAGKLTVAQGDARYVKQESGKGLSSNDYTTEEKEKLAGLSNYVHPDTPGNKHIPAGGTAGQALINNGDGSVEWGTVEAGGNGSVIVAGEAPPGDASTIWIDTTSGGIAKYWNGNAWVTSKAVWG